MFPITVRHIAHLAWGPGNNKGIHNKSKKNVSEFTTVLIKLAQFNLAMLGQNNTKKRKKHIEKHMIASKLFIENNNMDLLPIDSTH